MENKFAPLTEAEFMELDQKLAGIGSWLPEGDMGYIWQKFNQIRGANENQPCGCSSAGAHWKRAVDELNKFVKERK